MTDETPRYTARETQFEAMVRVRRDRPIAETVASLVADGHSPALAEAAVRKVFDGQVAERRRLGLQVAGVGALLFVIGGGLSLWMSMASSNSYVFLWGMVVFGLLQMGYGFMQYADAKPADPPTEGSKDAV